MEIEERTEVTAGQEDRVKEILINLWAHQQGVERDMVEAVEEM